MELIRPDVTREVNKKVLQSNNSVLKSFDNNQHVRVRNYRRGPRWVRGTVVRQIGLYRVKGDDQTWRRHIEQLRSSNPCPPAADVSDDCAIPGEVQLDMPSVVEPNLGEQASQAVRSCAESLSPEPESQQFISNLVMPFTRAGRVVRPPQRFKDYVCD